MESRKKVEDRVWQFDYLKAFAMIFVILLHVSWNDEQRQNIVFPLLINLAVPIFMFVSGYMNMRSYDRHMTNATLKDTMIHIMNQTKNLILPYIWIFAIETLYMIFIKRVQVSLLGAFKLFVLGGFGPGSYYIPVLWQFVVLFPVIFWIVRKNEKVGILSVLLVQFVLEILTKALGVPASVYRVLLFRHLVFIVLGIIFYLHHEICGYYVIASALIGGAYLYLISYTNYVPRIFIYWTSTSMPTVLWVCCLVYLVLNYMKPFPGILGKIFLLIGKSTYSIFLIQKLYFNMGVLLDKTKIQQSMIAVCVCCLVGISYQFLLNRTLFRKKGRI